MAHCIDHNLGGLNNLYFIPGTVGAAPIHKVGAYGVEIKDVLESVEVVDLSNAECHFSYRDTIFKHVLKGCLHLSRRSQTEQPIIG